MSLRGALLALVGLGVLCTTALAALSPGADQRSSLVLDATRPAAAPLNPDAPAPDADRPGRAVQQVDPEWVATTAEATGIPAPALQAYADAQLAVSGSCDVGWTTLAGIGWVESQHGTIGGRILGADGVPSTPILGPALDGEGAFAAIPATPESSRWHGDEAWDHAVGPMQFIPSTWATWASDGDGDGRVDPHDLDDAALAAARYLCADGHDLSTGEGWTAAVLSYNHATEYVDAVRSAALDYAARTP